jgi:hypothetical protein
MNDDHLPTLLSWDEQCALAGIERVLSAEEPVLAAALRHGATSPVAPHRQVLAVGMLTSCLVIGVTTFAGGELAGLAAALTLAAHRRRARAPRR